MTEIAMCLLPLGVAAILWVVLGHRSTMAHLQARREGSLGNEYDRGVREGLVQAAKMIEAEAARNTWSGSSHPAYVAILAKAAKHE